MCGRCACTRDRRGVAVACAYKPSSSDKTGAASAVLQPEWVGTIQHWPSYNVGPQTYVPCLISNQQSHVALLKKMDDQDGECVSDGGDRVLQAMKWGLVPNWHKGPQPFSTLLNNCRLDGITEKPSFRGALQKGQRCVVVVDGFYEWQTTKPGSKQPFFIYLSNNSLTEETQAVLPKDQLEGSQEELRHPTKGRMMQLAGLFDIWSPASEDKETLFTFTVITLDAHPSLAHIHDRMPAILDREGVEKWLDFKSVPTQQALRLLRPQDCLQWYPVSTMVNNVKHKSPECMVKIDPLSCTPTNPKQKTLTKYFSPKKSAPPKEEKETSLPPGKKAKLEDQLDS